MLPTEDKSQIGLCKYNERKGIFYGETPTIEDSLIDQHLYFTNDEEIKEGDWVLWFWDGGQIGVTEPQQYLGGEQVLNNGHRKITASTDPYLINQIKPYDTSKPYGIEFPQPSQAFIKAYCEQGGIDEVDVEYVKFTNSIPECDYDPTLGMCSVCSDVADCIHDTYTYKLKLNPDNTVITHLIEEKMYSIDDIESYCEKYPNDTELGREIRKLKYKQ